MGKRTGIVGGHVKWQQRPALGAQKLKRVDMRDEHARPVGQRRWQRTVQMQIALHLWRSRRLPQEGERSEIVAGQKSTEAVAEHNKPHVVGMLHRHAAGTHTQQQQRPLEPAPSPWHMTTDMRIRWHQRPPPKASRIPHREASSRRRPRTDSPSAMPLASLLRPWPQVSLSPAAEAGQCLVPFRCT